MITQAQLARHYGKSPMWACRMVKDGCPLDSFEAAERWLAENKGIMPPGMAEWAEDGFKGVPDAPPGDGVQSPCMEGAYSRLCRKEVWAWNYMEENPQDTGRCTFWQKLHESRVKLESQMIDHRQRVGTLKTQAEIDEFIDNSLLRIGEMVDNLEERTEDPATLAWIDDLRAAMTGGG